MEKVDDRIKEFTELLEEQDPKDLDKIFELVEKMIKEYKHLEAEKVYLNK
mgnify:FL=1